MAAGQRPPPATQGGLLGGFMNPFADMDAATQGGLLALAGNLMSARDRGMSFGGALGQGMVDFARTKASLAGQEDERKLRGLQTKAAERELAAGEKQAQAREMAMANLSPQERARAEAMGDAYWQKGTQESWRSASPEERLQGIAAVETNSGKPMLLPGEYNTSAVEQQRMQVEQLRFQAEQGNQAAMRQLQQMGLQIQMMNANKPQYIEGPNGEITAIAPPSAGGGITQVRPPDPRELTGTEIGLKQKTEDAILQAQTAMSKIREMQALNPDIPGGPTATIQKWWNWATDTDQYNKTLNFENLIQGGMLEQLQTTFQNLGPMSDSDMKVFRDAQASLDKPAEVRAEIFRRLEEVIARKLPMLQQRLEEVTSGQYGRAQQPAAAPPAAAPTPPQGAPGTPPPPPPGFK